MGQTEKWMCLSGCSLSCVQLFVTHGLQHARLPCPSPSPTVYSNSCPLSQWCPPTISLAFNPLSLATKKHRGQSHYSWDLTCILSQSSQIMWTRGETSKKKKKKIYIYMCVSVYVYICIHMYIHIYTHIHICIYTYTHYIHILYILYYINIYFYIIIYIYYIYLYTIIKYVIYIHTYICI